MDVWTIEVVGWAGVMLCLVVTPVFAREVWLREERRMARIARALLAADDGTPPRVAWPPSGRLLWSYDEHRTPAHL